MKTVWGFDLGTASIGSSIIVTDDEGKPVEIRHMGSRIIPQTDADSGKDGAFAQFLSGNAISKNASRTQRRTMRKGYDRYQMRRATLANALKKSGMAPDDTCSPLDKLGLWGLRSRAASERITLPELGRVLMHLNQKRGYKSARAEGNDKKETDYVQVILTRHQQLRDAGLTVGQYLCGDQVDVEHIIPRSLLFDDSMSNKTLSHQCCNREKGNQTARDYMEAKGPAEFAAYQERVDLLCKNSRTKRHKLLMEAKNIPTDFIDRQLRQSQYIARKATEMLGEVCADVWTTGGSVTAYLRRVWGWEDVLMQLQLPRYRDIEGATEWVEYERDGQTHRTERIVGWSKRDDHRHHAIDALTIACTRQGYIQRLNTLSRQTTRDQMAQALAEAGAGSTSGQRASLLERYIASQRPFTTAEVLEHTAGILVSLKSGKRVATPGVRKAGPRGERHVAQRVLVPRGALSEESVYGRIPDPVTGKPAYVIRYPLGPKFDKTDKIVDTELRTAVRDWLGSGAKDGEPFQWNGQTVRSVRCYTGLKPAAVEAVRHDPQTGTAIGFVKPGNNHHIAFYTDPAGKPQYQICTFWHTVERKRLGLPVIIRRPDEAWDFVQTHMERFTPGFLEKLPAPEWHYEFSLQQNEMVLLGLDPDIARAAIEQADYKLLGPHLYRLQKIGSTGYKLVFRHHLATTVTKDSDMVGISSFGNFAPIKVRIDLLGRITLPDEL